MGAEAQGVSNHRYTLIPRVLIFPVNENGKLLLLKGAADKTIWPGLWNGIGGHVEQGESIHAAAARELFEESGLTARKMIHCGQVVVDTGGKPGIIFFIFKVKELSGEVTPSVEGSLEWFSQVETTHLLMVEDLYTLIPLVMRQKPTGRPFWGYYDYDSSGQLRMTFRR